MCACAVHHAVCADVACCLNDSEAEDMPSVPEELNVFRRPHGHMVKLVKDIEREVGRKAANDSTHT